MDGAAPPCFRTLSFKLERSCAAVPGDVKISKSKKRHLREQRSAVRRAGFATEDLKSRLSHVLPASCQAEGSMSVAESLDVKVHGIEQTLSYWCQLIDGSCKAGGIEGVLNYLKPDAAACVPSHPDERTIAEPGQLPSGSACNHINLAEHDVCEES